MAYDLEDEEDLWPVFTTPSGLSLDGPLSRLLDTVADSIDSQRVLAVSVIMIDSDLNTAASRIICHPLIVPQLAKRLRQAADEMERSMTVTNAPESNQSAKVH